MKLIVVVCFAFLINCGLAAVDPSPEENLRQFLLDKYNRDVMPPHNSTNPVPVGLGVSLIAIHDVDAKEQLIHVNGWIEYSWNDSRLSWDPEQYNGINVLRIGAKYLWRPDVTLYNSFDAGQNEWPESSRTKHTVVYSDGRVLWIPAATIKAYCDVDLTYYPYDRHVCSLKFGSWVYDGFQLDLNLRSSMSSSDDHMDLSEMRNNSEWRVVSTFANKTVRYYPCCKEPYPDVTFYMTLERDTPIYQAAILFPVAAGIILAFTAFIMSPFTKHRQSINAFNLLIFLLTLFHLQQQLPVVGRNSPAIVLICESMTLLLSLAIAWGTITRAFVGRYNTSQPPRMVQWLNSSWPTKVLLVSKGDKVINMQESYKKASDVMQSNKDPELMAIVSEDKSVVSNGWMTFFSFLDRLAFVSFSVIVVALLVAFTR